MRLTILLAIIFILSVCLLLYAAVALIQDKRFFTTAPKDIQEAALDHPERFPMLTSWTGSWLSFPWRR